MEYGNERGLLAHKRGEWEQFHHGKQTKARELYDEAASFYKRALIIRAVLKISL